MQGSVPRLLCGVRERARALGSVLPGVTFRLTAGIAVEEIQMREKLALLAVVAAGVAALVAVPVAWAASALAASTTPEHGSLASAAPFWPALLEGPTAIRRVSLDPGLFADLSTGIALVRTARRSGCTTAKPRSTQGGR